VVPSVFLRVVCCVFACGVRSVFIGVVRYVFMCVVGDVFECVCVFNVCFVMYLCVLFVM